MGAGSLLAFCSPSGNGTPHTLRLSWYSFQPLPARYPRTTASTGMGCRRFTSMLRPCTCATSPGATTLSGASPVRWLGTMSFNCSNHHSAICVSSAPLPGIGSPMMTSKALMRSLATIRMRSSPTA